MPDKPRILIVDDSREVVELLRHGLGSDCCDIFYALDGGEGISRLDELRPDMVILDINLPDINGYEVLKEIRSREAAKDTVVIMLTGMAETEDIVKGLGMGADDYIIKPFNIIEIAARIKSHLTIRELRRRLMEMERLKTLHEVAVSFNHEINNSLMGISASAYFLKENMTGFSGECKRCVDAILTEAADISDIVKKLSAATSAASVNYSPGIKMIDFRNLKVGG